MPRSQRFPPPSRAPSPPTSVRARTGRQPALPPSIQGTISSYKCPRKNGPPAVYYNLQYTLNGKNHSRTIPVGMVDAFKNALASGKKLKDLVLELSDADARLLVEQSSALKKSSRTSS